MLPSLALALAAALGASAPPADARADNAKPDGGAKAARAYVERSYLIAPKQVSDFVFEGVRYNPDAKHSGAGFRYKVDGHQETRIDVYVYPAGRMDHATALDDGMQAYRADIDTAVKAGQYTDLAYGQEVEFPLASTAETSPLPADKPGKADRNLEAVLRALSKGPPQIGRKLPMTMHLQPQDWPMHSVGYLFYRQRYYIKVRATAAQQRIPLEKFQALTDRAARALAPAIEVASIGGCANRTIALDSDATPEAMAQEMLVQMTLQQSYNCHLDTEAAGIPAKSTNAEVIEIAYDAHEWKSE
jgi:hypothetical protein